MNLIAALVMSYRINHIDQVYNDMLEILYKQNIKYIQHNTAKQRRINKYLKKQTMLNPKYTDAQYIQVWLHYGVKYEYFMITKKYSLFFSCVICKCFLTFNRSCCVHLISW